MESFTYQALAIRICFGSGRFDDLAAEAGRLDMQRVLVLTTPTKRHLGEEVAQRLGPLSAGIFDQCRPHVPLETADAARAAAADVAADGIVAIGGGSTIGHGKAIKLERDVKLLHVVTTYSGSEMTHAQGFTTLGRKRLINDKRMLADTVIYDPDLTVDLPAEVSGPSGMNAMAHCVEALYGPNRSPVSSLMALAGIRALAGALPVVVREPHNIAARSDALYGAWISGLSLGAGMGLHHNVAHVLGGTFGLPHALAHTLALPHTVAYNHGAVADEMMRLAAALEAKDAPAGLYDLAQSLGIDMRLSALGFSSDKLDEAAQIVVEHAGANPRPAEFAPVRALLEDALHGRRPSALD